MLSPLDPGQSRIVPPKAPPPRAPDEAPPLETFDQQTPPPQVERRHERELEERYGTCEDAATAARLQRLADRLLPLVTRADVKYRLRALDTDLAFASACPNGTVFFSRGMLAVFSDDPPLLFFGAHELTHTELHHYETRQQRFAARCSGWARSPEERAALELAAVTEVRHQEEFEADQGAVAMLARLGLGVDIAVGALQRLWEAYRDLSPEALQSSPLSPGSHPSFPERIERLTAPEKPRPPAGQALRNLKRYLT